jgi:hypothetical protein
VALLAELLVADDVAVLTDVGPAGIRNEEIFY